MAAVRRDAAGTRAGGTCSAADGVPSADSGGRLQPPKGLSRVVPTACARLGHRGAPAASFGAIERAAPGGITAAGLGDTAIHGPIELLHLIQSGLSQVSDVTPGQIHWGAALPRVSERAG